MVIIRWKIFAPNEGASLCVNCVWGLVRRGVRGEEEIFCRFVEPNGRVPFAVRDCSGFGDRRVPAPAAKSTGRIGFAPVMAISENTEKEPGIAATEDPAAAGK